MKVRSIKDVSIKNARVVLRVDFNMPVKNGKVKDNYKIIRALPTIKQLLKNGNQIVLLSHLGRPGGKRVKSLSLKPVFDELRKLLVRRGVRMKCTPATEDSCSSRCIGVRTLMRL